MPLKIHDIAVLIQRSPQITVGGVICLFVLYHVFHTIYNVTFHPLAKFPGPKWRGAFFYCNYLEEIKGIQAKKVKALHDQYGPVVRIGPSSLSFNTSQAWKDIYLVRPGRPELGKDMGFFTQNTNGVPSILVSNHADHVRIRKLVIHSFSDQALRDQEPIITNYVDLLIAQLKAQVNSAAQGKVDLMSWFMYTTFDIMGDLCFAESFNALTSGSYHPWMTLILNAAKNGSYVRMERAYPLVAWFSNLYKRLKHPAADLSSARKTHMRYAVDKTEARMRMETDRLDIMTPILKKNSEKGMSRPEIQQTLILLLTGGTEPTASGMSGVAYNVLSHPRVLTKLKEEVVAAYGDGDEILNTKTSSMPYLNAVINESLRMYPPVPARFPRRTGPKGNIIDGHNVPSDISIGVHQWATYHSERNFHRCEEFIPERWLEDAPAEFKNDALDAVQPFSIGPRNCIGKPMGLLQIRQMLCKLLINFDMQLEPECVDWNNQKARLLWDMPPLWVKLRHRGA